MFTCAKGGNCLERGRVAGEGQLNSQEGKAGGTALPDSALGGCAG